MFPIATNGNAVKSQAKSVLTVIMLALVFSLVFHELALAFNATGLLAIAITLTPGILGVVALLKVLDIL